MCFLYNTMLPRIEWLGVDSGQDFVVGLDGEWDETYSELLEWD